MIHNEVSGQGTIYDQAHYRKIMGNRRLNLNEVECLLYDPIVRRILDARPQDVTRIFRDHIGDQSSEWESCDDELRTPETLELANYQGEAYGGSVIIPCLTDSVTIDEYAQPFNVNEYAGRDNLRGWLTFSPYQLEFDQKPNFIQDIRALHFGMPDRFKIGDMEFHSSWAIMRRGLPRSKLYLDQGQQADPSIYFGDSRLNLIAPYALRAISAMSTVDSLIQKSAIDVYMMQTMAEELSKLKNRPEEAKKMMAQVWARLEMLMSNASVNKPIVLDKEHEGLERSELGTGFSGATAAMEFFVNCLASAGDIPKTRLFGEQAKGLSNGGQADMKTYNASVTAYWRRFAKPVVDQMDSIVSVIKGLPAPEYELRDLDEESAEDKCKRLDLENKQDDLMLKYDIPFATEWVTRRARARGSYEITDEQIDEIAETNALLRQGGG